jgi:hypothetical protein
MSNPDKLAVRPLEVGRQQRHLGDSVLLGIDIDSISHIIGMLDEQENTSKQDLLHRRSNHPGETKDEGTGRSDERGDLGGLE